MDTKGLDIKVHEEKASGPNIYLVAIVTEEDGKEETSGRNMSLYVSQPFLGCSVTFPYGTDGAHSAMRQALGVKKIGDTSDSDGGCYECLPSNQLLGYSETNDHAKFVSTMKAIFACILTSSRCVASGTLTHNIGRMTCYMARHGMQCKRFSS